MGENVVTINRAPVLSLWGAVVSERLGWDWDTALTLGRAMAGLQAQSKGRALGIFKPSDAPRKAVAEEEPDEDFRVDLCGRSIRTRNTPDGARACAKGKPIEPAKVTKYLQGKFGEQLDAALDAMRELAASYDEDELPDAAFGLYEQFRPEISKGKKGWGQKGELDLAKIREMANR